MQGKNGEDFAICGVEMSLSGGVYPAVHAASPGLTGLTRRLYVWLAAYKKPPPKMAGAL
jgi:hypothetical protein